MDIKKYKLHFKSERGSKVQVLSLLFLWALIRNTFSRSFKYSKKNKKIILDTVQFHS